MPSSEDEQPRGSSPGPIRQLLGLAGPIAVGLLVAALGLELLARLNWEEGWRDPADHGGPEGEDLPVYHSLSELDRPNQRGIDRNVYYRTNSLGVRGPERSWGPPPGVFRIAVTGDSTTMGSGVLEEERYTDQLDRRLGVGVEVLNVGLSGLNTDDAVTRLERYLRQYRADLLVYGFSTNDIEGPAYRSRLTGVASAEFAKNYWEWVARVERSPSYFWQFLGARRIAWKSSGTKLHAEVLENFLENPEAWSYFLAGLDRFAALARRREVCAHVLLHPDLHDLDETHPYLEVYDRVEQAALERGLTVTQSFPYFARHSKGGAEALWVSLFDPHPNPQGHALLAEALYDGLMQLPPECWEPR